MNGIAPLRLHLAERPRERCLDRGPDCLSFRECLILILNSGPRGLGASGLATSILERPGSGLSSNEEERAFYTAMEVSASAHLKGIRGLGDASQARILAAFEIGRRYATYRLHSHFSSKKRLGRRKRPGSDLPAEALAKISQGLRNEPQEWLGFIPWHRTGEAGDFCLVERGVRTHVNIDPAELFARVLALRPRGFILAHNHPSGDPTPSPSDLELTEKVQEVSSQLGIRLVGHWIVTPHSEKWLTVIGPSKTYQGF